MKTALIIGITGQDGSYLAELLLAEGCRVIGTSRDLSGAAGKLSPALREKIEVVEWKMRDSNGIEAILAKNRPDEVYNLAAFSSGAGMFDQPVEMGEINGLAVTRILEAIRAVDAGIRFCQASSREIFGESPPESPQSETTPTAPRSPYGAAKLYADAMIGIFRRHHGLFACSAILFNHESPRRGLAFVTRKIARQAAAIKLGLEKELRLGNLDTLRDWGFAGDYVQAMRLMLLRPQAADFVVATGEVHSVREFCESAFAHTGLDYRDHVREDSASYRPSEPALLVGDIRKARDLLGWTPRVGFQDLVAMMVDAELRALAASSDTK